MQPRVLALKCFGAVNCNSFDFLGEWPHQATVNNTVNFPFSERRIITKRRETQISRDLGSLDMDSKSSSDGPARADQGFFLLDSGE